MDPIELIKKYYNPSSKAYRILLTHSQAVANKSKDIAINLGFEKDRVRFIWEAAMLHDIGICKTFAPQMGCRGNKPYLCHGIEGKKILDKEGYKKHAHVCERHTGVGITAEDVRNQKLPLPARDLSPRNTDEEIICYADLFFSKSSKDLKKPNTIEDIKRNLSRFGMEKVKRFELWHKKFSK